MKLLQFILFYLRNDLAIEVETVFEFFGQTPPGGGTYEQTYIIISWSVGIVCVE